MNKAGRKVVEAQVAVLNGAVAILEGIIDDIDEGEDQSNVFTDVKNDVENASVALGELRDEEREKFENMPEGLQASDTGQKIDAAADALENACDNLDGIDFDIDLEDEEALEQVKSAIEDALSDLGDIE